MTPTDLRARGHGRLDALALRIRPLVCLATLAGAFACGTSDGAARVGDAGSSGSSAGAGTGSGAGEPGDAAGSTDGGGGSNCTATDVTIPGPYAWRP